jgi:hypothetical protein
VIAVVADPVVRVSASGVRSVERSASVVEGPIDRHE